MSRHSKKLNILHAAAKVVSEKGIFNLTLQAVAKEAGISKGGLLYHYASKEKLVEDMVTHLAENYLDKIEQSANEDQKEEGKWSRAFLDVTLNKTYANKDMNSGLLAAKAINPELMKPVQDAYAYWQNQLGNDGIDPIKATIVRLAADGIWLSQLFDLNQLDEETLDQVHERLKSFIDQKE